MMVRDLAGTQRYVAAPSLRIPNRSAPLSVKTGIWGDTPQSPRAWAAPPRPLHLDDMYVGDAQTCSSVDDVEVTAARAFGLETLKQAFPLVQVERSRW
jgi:hypothetical protein